MASDTKRTMTAAPSSPLQVSLHLREHDAFACAYADQAAGVTSTTTAITATPGSETSPTGFTDLPRELRDKIYELAVVNRNIWSSQVIESASTHGVYSNATVNQVSSMGQVSKQVRREAFEMYFKYNCFVIGRIQGYKNGHWLGWASDKKMANLLKQLTRYYIPLGHFPRVFIEQQSDGTWEGGWDWDEVDWDFVFGYDPHKNIDDIIEKLCDEADAQLNTLLMALEKDRDYIADAINVFKKNIILMCSEAKDLVTEREPRG